MSGSLRQSVNNFGVKRQSSFHHYRYIVLLLAAISNALLVFIVSMGLVQNEMVNKTAISLQQKDKKATTYDIELTTLYPVSSNMNSTTNENSNSTIKSDIQITKKKEKDGPFAWSSTIQALNNNAFQVPFAFVQIFGGNSIVKLGAFKLSAVGQFVSGLSSFLIPILAYQGWGFVVLMRAILGLGLGLVYPCVYRIVEEWSTPAGRVDAIAAVQIGSGIGNTLSPFVAGILCSFSFLGGWPLVFYSNFVLVLIWLVLWLIYASDNPQTHRYISDKELYFLKPELMQSKNLESETACHTSGKLTNLDRENPTPTIEIDWRQIVGSKPIWAAIYVYSLYCTTNTFMVFNVSTYLNLKLGFDSVEQGWSVAAMNIGIMFSYILCGYLDRKLSLQYSKQLVRKIILPIGAFTTGLLCTVMIFISVESTYTTVGCLIIARLFHGFIETQLAAAVFDMAPDFSGVLMGFVNGVSALSAFAILICFGALLDANDNSLSCWRWLFFACAVMLWSSAFAYVFFVKFKPIFRSSNIDVPDIIHAVNLQDSQIRQSTNTDNGKQETKTNGTK